jgi:hypothetical protein
LTHTKRGAFLGSPQSDLLQASAANSREHKRKQCGAKKDGFLYLATVIRKIGAIKLVCKGGKNLMLG